MRTEIEFKRSNGSLFTTTAPRVLLALKESMFSCFLPFFKEGETKFFSSFLQKVEQLSSYSLALPFLSGTLMLKFKKVHFDRLKIYKTKWQFFVGIINSAKQMEGKQPSCAVEKAFVEN